MVKKIKAIGMILCMMCLNLAISLTVYADAAWKNTELMQTAVGYDGLYVYNNGLYYTKRNLGTLKFHMEDGTYFNGIFKKESENINYFFAIKDGAMVRFSGKESGILYEDQDGMLRAHNPVLQKAAEKFI